LGIEQLEENFESLRHIKEITLKHFTNFSSAGNQQLCK